MVLVGAGPLDRYLDGDAAVSIDHAAHIATSAMSASLACHAQATGGGGGPKLRNSSSNSSRSFRGRLRIKPPVATMGQRRMGHVSRKRNAASYFISTINANFVQHRCQRGKVKIVHTPYYYQNDV